MTERSSYEESILKVREQVNFASYVCNGLPLIFWILLFYRIYKLPDRAKYWVLMVICLLMMASLVSSMVYHQLIYTYWDNFYDKDLRHPELMEQILGFQLYTTHMTFNLAEWLFAFTIFTLSCKMEVTKNNLPEHYYNCRLNTANIFVTLFNLIAPAAFWFYAVRGSFKEASIANSIEQVSLAMSCITLIWGICRMVRIVGSKNGIIPKKISIIMHIVAYLFVVPANVTMTMKISY